MAKEVETSEDRKNFERTFEKVAAKQPEATKPGKKHSG